MTIPEIRERMHELADIYGIQELHFLAEETRRRTPVRHVRRPRQSSVDADMERSIRAYAAQHPEATMFDIGQQFNVNQGRVSEALGGFRK